MLYILIGVGILVCSFLAIQTRKLLLSAVWLAITSALVAILLYMLGAPHIAVIELSVGAGLVTVLFVFAINISGEDVTKLKSIISKPVAIGAVFIAVALGIFLILRSSGVLQFPPEFGLPSSILWEERYLDFLLQIVLVFSGVLGVIGLLADGKDSKKQEVTE